MKVENMQNEKGNVIPNQFSIVDDDGNRYFQSYNSIIVKIGAYLPTEIFPCVVLLDEKYYNYSKTTAKYRNIFLNEDTKTVERKIKTGEYKLVNLNG